MTIPVETVRYVYSGPYQIGETVPIVFSYSEEEHVKLLKGDKALTFNVDYTVLGKEATLNIAVADDEIITVYRETPLNNEAAFPQESPFNSEKIENAIDKLTRQNQEQEEQLSRAIKLPLNAPTEIKDLLLPLPEPDKGIKWNTEGNALVNTEYDPDIALNITKQYRDEAEASAQAAKTSETNAKASEQAAKTSETNAKASEQATEQYKNETQAIANKALQDISTAENSAISNIQTEGGKYVQEAKDWAIKMDGKVNGEDYSSKYYADQAKILTAGSLNQKQITNCILEVPQRIKWEVIDGVFYIKAGSVLTRPNGWIDKEQGIRKFEYKTLDTNIALSQITNKNTVNVILFFVGAKQSGNEGLWYFDNEINVFSQDTPPAVSIAANMWYDTDNNIIKYTTDSGKNWIDEEIYFPTGIVSIANGAFDSVVDIFNGSGFIGSCGWVDRGVKALFSNGRNNDGTLKNVEASTTEISIGNPLGYRNAVSHMLLELNQDNSVTLGWLLHVYEGYVLPSIVSSDNEYFYHKTENIWYYHKVNETEWQKATKIPIILRRCWFDENTRIQSSSVNTPVSLAKEQDIDGKYTTRTMYLMRNATLTKNYNKTFDLSSYLPNDNHPYMVLVDAILRTGSVVNNSFGLYVKSNLMANTGCLCRAVTRTDKVNAIAGCTSFIPVGSDHTISLLAGDESNASTFANSTSISLNGFRRIR